MTLGPFPQLSLKAARRQARDAIEKVVTGLDPGLDKQAARHRPSDREQKFPALAALFLDRWLTKAQQRPRPRTIEENARLLGLARQDGVWVAKKGGLADKWKGRAISSLARADVVDVLDQIVADGKPTKANHARAVLHLFFGWCMRRGVIDVNPVTIIDRPAPRKARDRVLSDSELALFWRAADDDAVFGAMYKLLLLTGQRRDEVRAATWQEFDFENATWTLPGTRTKNHRTHVVPLSPQAITLLNAIPRIGRRPRLLFTTTGDSMISGLSRGKERLDRRMLELAHQSNIVAAIPPFVIHDIRRSCATGMQRLGVRLEVIERVLNHSGGSFAGIVGVYQRYSYDDEMRAALSAWGAHIDSIIGAQAAGNVVKLRA